MYLMVGFNKVFYIFLRVIIVFVFIGESLIIFVKKIINNVLIIKKDFLLNKFLNLYVIIL